jgi:hypothetical protein
MWGMMESTLNVREKGRASRARAFFAGPRQGVTYAANVWHRPLTILDRPAAFAVFMWLDGGAGDEEFFELPATVTIALESILETRAMPTSYDRDLIGYGANPPNPAWPGDARLAVNFVMNYEEGSEPSVQDGEGLTEVGLTEAHGRSTIEN